MEVVVLNFLSEFSTNIFSAKYLDKNLDLDIFKFHFLYDFIQNVYLGIL